MIRPKFKVFFASAISAVVASCAAPAMADKVLVKGTDFIIRYDNGGRVNDYIDKADKLRAKGLRVVIDGTCASACVIYLHQSLGLDYCATERAKVGFHVPVARRPMGHISRLPSEVAEAYRAGRQIVAGLPPILREEFALDRIPDANKGDDPDDLKWVSGKDAQRAIGACN